MSSSRNVTSSMEIVPPSTEGYTIYTKKECKYCTQTKELLAKETCIPTLISCDVYLETTAHKMAFLDAMRLLCKREHKTFPFVFCNGLFVGGHSETEIYVRQVHAMQDALEDNDF